MKKQASGEFLNECQKLAEKKKGTLKENLQSQLNFCLYIYQPVNPKFGFQRVVTLENLLLPKVVFQLRAPKHASVFPKATLGSPPKRKRNNVRCHCHSSVWQKTICFYILARLSKYDFYVVRTKVPSSSDDFFLEWK